MRNFILFILVGLVFFSCKKENETLMFTEKEKELALYYAYNVGDTLKFLINNTDTAICIVSNKEFNETTYTSLFHPPRGQSISIYLKDIENHKFYSIYTKKNIDNKITYLMTNIRLYNLYNLFTDNNNKDTAVIINNVEYNNTILLTQDSTRVIIDKNEGILKAYNNQYIIVKI